MRFDTLKLGDLVPGPQLFGGVCNESIELMVVDVSRDNVVFSGSYMGVNLGSFTPLNTVSGTFQTLEEI